MRRILGALLALSATAFSVVGASRTSSSVTPPPTVTVNAPTSIYEFFADRTGVQCEMGRADTSWVTRDYAYCQSVSADISVSFERGRESKVCDDQTSCLGNPGLNTPRLSAGEVVGSGSITCAINAEGVTCRDPEGYGFQMTRDHITPIRP